MTASFCPHCGHSQDSHELTKESCLVNCKECRRVYFISMANERWLEIFGVDLSKPRKKTKG